MCSVDLIYQYLKEYSKETVEQFDDLMDQVMVRQNRETFLQKKI